MEEVLPAVRQARRAQGDEVSMASVEAAPRPSIAQRVAQWPRDVVTFYREVMLEMSRVTWPDRAQVIDATWKILVIVLFVGLVIAFLDLILQQVLVRWLPSIFT